MEALAVLLLASILRTINPHAFPEWGWTIFWIFFALEVIVGTIVDAFKD